MHTTNYYNTFVAVADDCPTQQAVVPPLKGTEKTVAHLQFELMEQHPYQFTSDEVLFQVHALRKNITDGTERELEREQFFSKGQACLRASPLTKRYGWGVHFNEEGKVALYAVDSEEYKRLIVDERLKQLKGMRSKR